MDHKEVQMLAAEFVLGTLNRAMLLQFKNELSTNPALRAAVKDWERRFGMERGGMLLHPSKSKGAQAPLGGSAKEPALGNRSNRLGSQKRDESKPSRKVLGAPAGDPLLDLQTQREVQAALDQISLDSTLASRVRCGQTAQRVPHRTTAAKPAASRPNLARSENTALALAGDSGMEPHPDGDLEAQKDTNAQELSAPPENADSHTAAEAKEHSRNQAALKVQSVLKAAQNILAKQNLQTRQRSASLQENLKKTPKEASKDVPEETTENPAAPPLRAEEGEWEALAPKVYKKQLNRDDNFNRQSYLLRMIPGGCIQLQRRGGIEEVYVVEGRVVIGDETLRPGDFQAFEAKSFVPEISAASDSLILIRGHIVERILDPEDTA